MTAAKIDTVYDFECAVYPRRLWVVVGREQYADRFDGVSPWDESAYAMVDSAYDKLCDKGGYLVRFESVEALGCWRNSAHEAVHVAAEIYKYCGIAVELDNQEHFAYLVGWVADCMQKVYENVCQLKK